MFRNKAKGLHKLQKLKEKKTKAELVSLLLPSTLPLPTSKAAVPAIKGGFLVNMVFQKNEGLLSVDHLPGLHV